MIARKDRRILAALAAAALGIAVIAPLAGWHASPAAAVTIEPEAPDFASESYNDPWDYSNPADQNTDQATAQNINVSGGSLNMDVVAGSSFDPVTAIPSALGWGRDGSQLSINTSRYKHLSFSLTTNFDRNEVGALYWFTCGNELPSCAGGVTFTAKPGTNVYDLDLTAGSTIGSNIPWSGNMVALRMIPAISLVAGSTKHVSFDWMRLYAPSANSPHGEYPPGVYPGYTIDPLPEVVIDSPNPQEGQSIAQAQLGHEWDFTSYANMAGVSVNNALVTAYDGRGMTATNAAGSGDPQVGLPVSPFDGTKYHNLTFDLSYDGPFSLGNGAGGGKLARVIWTTSSSSGIPQETNDMVTYSGANQTPISVDLNRSDVLDENSRSPRVGWAGQTITSLRFDPNEDVGTNTWHLKNVAFRADPAAVGQTTVRFHDAKWVPGTTATVLVGTAGPGGPGYTTIASGVSVASGVNSVPFALGSLPEGSYHVEVILQHPSGTAALRYSSVPVTMTQDRSADPRGSFDTTQRAAGGIQVSGWAFDSNSASPIQVQAYVDGTFANSFMTSIPRGDVQAVFPTAPSASGFSSTVTVGAGSHRICLYGINVGPGTNALISCKQVSVSTSPTGSLDVAYPTPGGFTVAGWALDPDTTSPISVDVYANSAGSRITANGTRNDVAAVWPGYGASHGFSLTQTAATGSYNVCAYGINVADGANTTLGCRQVSVGTNAPFGSLDSATRVTGGVQVQGWAIDPDAAQIDVAVYVNGVRTTTRTTNQRGDVNAVFPQWSGAHGYSVVVPAAAGATVCTYALDSNGTAGNTTLGCRVA